MTDNAANNDDLIRFSTDTRYISYTATGSAPSDCVYINTYAPQRFDLKAALYLNNPDRLYHQVREKATIYEYNRYIVILYSNILL